MTYYYVRIERLNGRQNTRRLGEWLNSSGVIGADYNEGGWADGMVKNVSPHLRFEREDDAIAYVLAHGGNYMTHIPEEVSPDYSI